MIWQFPKYTIGTELNWNNLQSSYPWIDDMSNTPQDSEWHGEGDVLTHTKMVVAELLVDKEFQSLNNQEKQILVTAAICHDIEKRSTTAEEVIEGKKRLVSPRHAKKGEFTTRELLYKEFTTPFLIREEICKLVRLHGLPLWAITKNSPQKEVIFASQNVDTRLLYLLAKADINGRICPDKDSMTLRLELFKELCLENDCFGKKKVFTNNYGRYLYFNKAESSPDYQPFDDLKCTVTVMCALPGSGKDYYIKENLKLPILSLDDIRRERKISPTDKKLNGRVIQEGKERAKAFLRKSQSFVFNATNITSDMRKRWIEIFTAYGARVKIIYIEVPYKQLLKQNKNRENPVPQIVIDNMIRKLELPTSREAHDLEFIVSK